MDVFSDIFNLLYTIIINIALIHLVINIEKFPLLHAISFSYINKYHFFILSFLIFHENHEEKSITIEKNVRMIIKQGVVIFTNIKKRAFEYIFSFKSLY